MRRTKEPEQQSTATGKKPCVSGENRWTPPPNGPVIRPANTESLILALQTGRLDQRTAAAQDVKAMRNAIAAAPFPVAAGLCRDLLAVHAVMLAGILREVSKPGQGVTTSDGIPNPLLVKHIPEIQKNILAAVSALQKLEPEDNPPATGKTDGSAKSKPKFDDDKTLDVSSLVLELTAPAQKESYDDD